jgi:protein RecA
LTKKKKKVENVVEESTYQKIIKVESVDSSEREKALEYITNDIKQNMGTFDKKEELIFVPTRLMSFNRASVLGGWPMGTIGEAHGPNAAGKTIIGIELLQSFIELGHIGVFCDAERAAADKKWISQGLGLDLSKCIYFVPDNIEDASERINKMINNFKEAKAKKKVDEKLLMFILVDSATKLVPDEMIKNGLKKTSMGLQARMFSLWLKSLTTLVGPKENEQPCVSILFINQERKNIGAKPWEPQYYSTCGEALQYDATVRMRVSFAGKVKEGEEKVGKKHKIVVEKNKVGFPDSEGYFYTSNGKGIVPLGIDFYREAIDECLLAGIFTKEGNFISSKMFDIKMQEKKLIKYLMENPKIMNKIRQVHQEMVLNGEVSYNFNSDDLEESLDE